MLAYTSPPCWHKWLWAVGERAVGLGAVEGGGGRCLGVLQQLLRTAGEDKGSVLAAKAVETRGKGGVLAAKALETQGGVVTSR